MKTHVFMRCIGFETLNWSKRLSSVSGKEIKCFLLKWTYRTNIKDRKSLNWCFNLFYCVFLRNFFTNCSKPKWKYSLRKHFSVLWYLLLFQILRANKQHQLVMPLTWQYMSPVSQYFILIQQLVLDSNMYSEWYQKGSLRYQTGVKIPYPTTNRKWT